VKQQHPLDQLKQPIALSLLFISTSTAVYAQDQVEEVVVISRQRFLETEFTARRTSSNVDAAKLITKFPAVQLTTTDHLQDRYSIAACSAHP